MIVRGRQPENFILGEKPGERRKAGNRQHGNKKRYEGDRHPSFEPAHLAHVLLMVHGVNHAARAEEETGFKKRMRHQMKNRRRVAAHADADKHVTQLADGRIGEDFFYVVLGQGDARRDQSGGDADHRDHMQGRRRHGKENIHPRGHVDAGGHHRRGVNQCAHRSRSSHRVRQPNEKRNLRRFAGGADKKKERRQRDDRPAPEQRIFNRRRPLHHLAKG